MYAGVWTRKRRNDDEETTAQQTTMKDWTEQPLAMLLKRGGIQQMTTRNWTGSMSAMPQHGSSAKDIRNWSG